MKYPYQRVNVFYKTTEYKGLFFNVYLNEEVFVYSAIIQKVYYILESRTKLTALSIGFGMML